MDDRRCVEFFREPNQPQQRRYEALRAFFLERRPLPDVARQWGFAHGTLRNLVSQFRVRCRADQVPPFSWRRPADDPPARVTLPHVRRRRPSPMPAHSP